PGYNTVPRLSAAGRRRAQGARHGQRIRAETEGTAADSHRSEPGTAGGARPTFQRTVGGQDYETRIRARMLSLIQNFHGQFQARETQRNQPDALHD
ncbi:MAG: hypothetical protein AAGC55_17755, partial [Myxococcota bacterium]